MDRLNGLLKAYELFSASPLLNEAALEALEIAILDELLIEIK
ncbi:hypothetical protein [Metabacillus kandeliae]|nr:hypothetical protein [Metabacillus kandeliae]